jgi:NAD+ synthase (glutamine-hydrolysing)
VLICEDIWGNVSPQYYAVDPVTSLINQDLDQIFHISASPFERKKMAQRVAQLKRVATLCCTTVLSVNQVGGYTELLFDGHSVSVDKNNVVNYHSYPFEVGVFNSRQSKPFVFDSIKEIETAIVFGITEYVRQSGYTAVVMGVSGGLDSAVVAALAVRALGKKKVTLISLPSQFNSDETKNDARLLANRLGAAFNEVSIEEYRRQMDHSLALEWGDLNDLCRQNIQARIRGVILMAMSNQTNALLLSTGNKSELAMGYATLYGDMCGALNPIGDVYKTQVVELANWINQPNEIIPQRIIDRPPSAELAFNQRDDDTLPPYADLDRILDQRINQGYSVHELCEMNDNKTVEFVLKRLKKNEFKRFQSPPILRLSNKSFGRGWHFPLVY